MSRPESRRSRRGRRSARPTAICTAGRASKPRRPSGRSVERVQRAEAVLGAAERDARGRRKSERRAADADRHVVVAPVPRRSRSRSTTAARRAALAGVDGVLGTLLDLVEVDDGWQAAFEAAVGEALAAVVVDGTVAARRALTALNDGGDRRRGARC